MFWRCIAHAVTYAMHQSLPSEGGEKPWRASELHEERSFAASAAEQQLSGAPCA
ncbi:MAG: hypothetical protein OXH00_17900 [Candidatus Poribacteria bacterium]|nr:hypothetical protein [Candidatus Poribacteria bacterium]